MTKKHETNFLDLIARLEDICYEIEDVYDEVESLADDEQDKYDGLSDELRFSELGKSLKQSVDGLALAYERLRYDAIDVIDEAIDAIKEGYRRN